MGEGPGVRVHVLMVFGVRAPILPLERRPGARQIRMSVSIMHHAPGSPAATTEGRRKKHRPSHKCGKNHLCARRFVRPQRKSLCGRR